MGKLFEINNETKLKDLGGLNDNKNIKENSRKIRLIGTDKYNPISPMKGSLVISLSVMNFDLNVN